MRRMLDARTGLEVIDPDECRRLLAGDEIGRLAVADGGTPTVFPVNYVVDGSSSAAPRARSWRRARAPGWRSRSTTSTGPAAPAGAWS